MKACIAKQIHEFDFPDRKLVLDSYVHDLSKLLNISGVKALHDEEMGTNRAFATNWSLVKEWTEESRYKTSVPEAVVGTLLVVGVRIALWMLPPTRHADGSEERVSKRRKSCWQGGTVSARRIDQCPCSEA